MQILIFAQIGSLKTLCLYDYQWLYISIDNDISQIWCNHRSSPLTLTGKTGYLVEKSALLLVCQAVLETLSESEWMLSETHNAAIQNGRNNTISQYIFPPPSCSGRRGRGYQMSARCHLVVKLTASYTFCPNFCWAHGNKTSARVLQSYQHQKV